MTPEMSKLKIAGRGGVGGIGGLIRPLEAISYGAGMGKGLKEPVPPYRQAYVFGADLGTPNANSWNYMPEVVDPTSVFDLSQITPNHEVVVAVLYIANIPAGMQSLVEHKWYRDRDGKLLLDFPFTIADAGKSGYAGWAWFYVYSYIGYTASEIFENGNYHVDLTFSGPGSYSRTLDFSGQGIILAPQLSEFQIADYIKV